MNKRISTETLSILSRCTVTPSQTAIVLPEQLERKAYQDVNIVLELMGGKWSRRHKVHTFPEDPTDLLDTVLLTGQITDTKKLFQQFYTPVHLVDHVLELADLHQGQRILEPSAGKGIFAERLRTHWNMTTAVAVELDPANARLLLPLCANGTIERVLCGDFLRCDPFGQIDKNEPYFLGRFSRIIMNPPFTRGQDIRHILHAKTFLGDRGILLAICANGPRQREILKPHTVIWEDLPAGTFSESGTNVNTALAVFRG